MEFTVKNMICMKINVGTVLMKVVKIARVACGPWGEQELRARAQCLLCL